MTYSRTLRRMISVTVISLLLLLLHLDEISAFVTIPPASSATIARVAILPKPRSDAASPIHPTKVLSQSHRRLQTTFNSSNNNVDNFLVDVALRTLCQFKQSFGAATLFIAVLTSPIVSIHTTAQHQYHLSIKQSHALAITENQQFIADIWFAVSAQYFDPTYNGLGEDGWRKKEQEAMKAVANTGPEDTDVVEGAIQIMLLALNDPYTRYLPKEKYAALTAYATNTLDGDTGGGIGVQLLENPRTKNVMIMATTSGGPAELAGLQIGDVIVKIDGMDVSESSAELVAAKFRGLPGGKVDVDYLRNDDGGAEKDVFRPGHVTLTRAKLKSNNNIQATTFVSAGGKTISVLKVPSFTTDTVQQLVHELRSSSSSVDAIAIDLRGNVGGYMPAGVDAAKLFLPARAHIIAEVGQSSSAIKTYDADGIGAELSLPLYILVDARTASASEIFASALQDNRRAVIVGTTNTFGKGRIQNVQPLQGGSGIAVTRARYITPSGRDLNGVGILPERKPEQCEEKDAAQICLANIV